MGDLGIFPMRQNKARRSVFFNAEAQRTQRPQRGFLSRSLLWVQGTARGHDFFQRRGAKDTKIAKVQTRYLVRGGLPCKGENRRWSHARMRRARWKPIKVPAMAADHVSQIPHVVAFASLRALRLCVKFFASFTLWILGSFALNSSSICLACVLASSAALRVMLMGRISGPEWIHQETVDGTGC